MKKIDLKKYKLRIRMAVTSAMLAVIPLLVFSVITYGVFIRDSNKLVTDSLTATFRQMTDRMDEHFNTVSMLMQSFSRDEEVQQILKENTGELSAQDRDSLRQQMQDNIRMSISVNDGYVITNGGEVVTAFESSETGFISGLLSKEDIDYKKGAFLTLATDEAQNQIAAVRRIRHVDTGETLGHVVFLTDKQKIIEIFETDLYGENKRFLMLDSSSNLVFSPEDNKGVPVLSMHESMPKNAATFVSSIEYMGEKYKYVINRTEQTNWEIIVMVPESELYSHSVDVGYTIVVYILIILCIAIALTTVATFRITKPITKLAEGIDRVASGDFKHKITFQEKNEITVIADNFNNMVDEVQGLTKKIFSTQQRLYEAELESKQYEVSLLQSQINSHFLYNTLSCIRGMSRKGAEKEVSDMITSLVHMLRYASDIREKSSLGAEYKNIKNYVQIQRMRLGEQLRLIFVENDDIIDCEVPKMILQPVVENSILHGFDRQQGNWNIRVYAKLFGETLKIYVLDNGCGITKERLAELNRSLREKRSIYDTTTEKNSIGLVNIQNRIRSMYGEQYGMRVRSFKNMGTAVIIEIPYKRSEEYV